MANGPGVRSDLPYDTKQTLRKALEFDSKLDQESEEVIDRFDSAGERTVERSIQDLSGAEIRTMRTQMREERHRLRCLIDIIADVEDQIDRSLR